MVVIGPSAPRITTPAYSWWVRWWHAVNTCNIRVHTHRYIHTFVHTWRLFNSAEWKAPFSRRYARKTGGRRSVSRTSAQIRTHMRPRKHEGESSREKRFVGWGHRDGRWCRCAHLHEYVRLCVWRRSAYTRVNAYCSRTGGRAGEGRVGSSAWTYVYRTYVLLPLRTTHADRGVLEVGAPTRGRERDGGGAGGRGWTRLDGRDGQPSEWYRVAVCNSAYCVPRVSVKIYRSVRREGEGRSVETRCRESERERARRY